MKSTAFLLTVFLIVSSTISLRAGEVAKPSPVPQKATAAQLIEDAKRALAVIAKAAKESTDKSLDLKNVRQQPFWSALKTTEESVMHLEAQLKTRNLSFFNAVNSSTQSIAELRGALPRSGIKHPTVESAVKALCNALTVLRKNYGVEALRRKQGGDLSEQERAEFTKLKEAERKLVTQLEMLKGEVKANAHLTAELTRLIAQLNKSIDAPFSVDELNTALELVNVIEGEWEAYSYYVEPKNRKAWQNADVAESLKTVGNIGKETQQNVSVADWSFLEENSEFSADLDVTVEIDVNEVEGYIHYIVESVDGIDIEMYYEEATQDDLPEQAFDELQNQKN